MSHTLFGTDGVRGRAGQFPLDIDTIRRLGAALVQALPHSAEPAHLLVGRDTRESGGWIEREFACGAASAGAVVESAGVMPTPAIAYLTGARHYVAGIVISASHNPFDDNGIKVFAGSGAKYTGALEADIEARVADRSWATPNGDAADVATVDLTQPYLAHAAAVFGPACPRQASTLAIDCGHGATVRVAPDLLRTLGFDLVVLGAEPDGRNINLACGSTHPEALQRAVVEHGCALGVAFDGDGDRAIFVDADGRLVDGDAVMYLCAARMRERGTLRGGAVAATVMSNIGLEIALRELGIGMLRCPVGDKYVMEEMVRRDLALGGEQSGHIIFMDTLFTGDGLVTAVQVLRAMGETGQSLAQLAAGYRAFPQTLVNVRVREKRAWTEVPAIADAVTRVESRLDGRGRLLVRYSGTEPLLRVMIEGERQSDIEAWADEIAQAVRDALG